MNAVLGVVAFWTMVVLLLGIAILIIRKEILEWREAYRKDEKEQTNAKYIRYKLIEYGIIITVCVAAFIIVGHLKDGPLHRFSEFLYGKPVEVIPNPFNGGFGE
jgi:hypothetical protein